MFQLVCGVPRSTRRALAAGLIVTLAGCGGGGGAAPAPATGASAASQVRSAGRFVAGRGFAAGAFERVWSSPWSQSQLSASNAPTPIEYPIGLAVNADDELYVANHYNGASQILVYGKNDVQIPARTITHGLVNPAGLAFDKAGNLYEADVNQMAVNVYNKAGKQLASRTLHTDPNYNPSGVAIDSKGDVWVALRTGNDIEIGEIQVFNAQKNVILTITTGLVYPLGIAFSTRTHDAWVGNGESPNDTITVYNASGKLANSYPTSGFTPSYDAFDKQGDIYFTNALGSSVGKFNQNGVLLQTITDGVNAPYGIALNSEGDVYVANVAASVNKYGPAGALLKTLK